MVEQIKKLRAKFQTLTFRDGRCLMQGEVPIANPRAAADGTFRVSERPQRNRVIGEESGIEPITAVCTRILCLEGASLIRLTWQLEIKAIHFLDIVLRSDADGEAALSRNDSREIPS